MTTVLLIQMLRNITAREKMYFVLYLFCHCPACPTRQIRPIRPRPFPTLSEETICWKIPNITSSGNIAFTLVIIVTKLRCAVRPWLRPNVLWTLRFMRAIYPFSATCPREHRCVFFCRLIVTKREKCRKLKFNEFNVKNVCSALEI